MRYPAIIIFAMLFVIIVSCEKNKDGISSPIEHSFPEQIYSILQNNCISCHSGSNARKGLKLDSWDHLIKGSNHGEAVIPFDSENSLLIELLTKLVNGPHPFEQGADSLTAAEVQALVQWIDNGAMNEQGKVPYQNSTNRLYVCNQNSAMVSIIDTDAKVVIRNIKFPDLGYSTSAKPHDTAVEPGGQHWFVTLIGDGKVLKFDTDYNLVGEADFESAGLLAMHPTKDLLYVGHTLSIPTVPSNVAAITRSSMNLTPIPLIYDRPHAFIADHSGRYVYSASLTQNHYGIIDTDQDPSALEAAINFPEIHTLVQMNISPDDQEIYVSSQLTAQLLVLDSSDPLNLAVIDSVSVGQAPWHPKFTPDGSKVYVGNNMSHTVSVVNTSSRMEEDVIGAGDGSEGLAQPHGLVISPDGKFVYVTNRNVNGAYTPRYDLGDNANAGTVAVINTSTNTIEKVIELEEFPSGISIYEQ